MLSDATKKNATDSELPVKSLTIKNVASFKEPAILSLKKYNFIYGLNGSGKTTISRLLANQECDGYEDCEVVLSSPRNPPEILVYNEGYVKNTFHTEDKQKAIFTLDESNKKVIEDITRANKRKADIDKEKKPLDDQLIALRKSQNNASNRFIDDIYEYKRKYYNTALKDCFKGYNSKVDFKNKVINTTPHELEIEKIPDRIDVLKREYSELSDKNSVEKIIFPLLEANISEVERDNIFSEIIVGSTESYLSKLIDELDHESWVTQGIQKYLDKTDNCPFCFRELDSKLKDKIKSHIDNNYQQKIDQLRKLKNTYSVEIKKLAEVLDIYEGSDLLMKNQILKNECKTLRITLHSNAKKIDQKIASPNKPAELTLTDEELATINDIIKGVNEYHTLFNEKLKNANSAKAAIADKFWQLIRKLADKTISDYDIDKENKDKEVKLLNKNIAKLEKRLNYEDTLIKDLQSKTKNVDKAIEWINKTIKSLGLIGFEIEKIMEGDLPFYRLKRGDSNDKVFHSLSEGEKTLLSFLYFIQSCIGVDDADSAVSIEDRVIVIDDPISSLSFNHVFDIACLIKKTFFSDDKPYGQVIILTHHLYFLHEMFSQIERNAENELGKKFAIFRVFKGENSAIKKIKRSDIQNNYESYWQTIKDVQTGKASPVILPNAMRNILEHYFNFIHCQNKLRKAFEELRSQKTDDGDIMFSTFERYMNKESHSDAINYTDVKEIDHKKFISYFEDIFKQTGFQDHYNKMMGTNDSSSVSSSERKKAT